MKSIKYLIALVVAATLFITGFSSFSTPGKNNKNKPRATENRIKNPFEARNMAEKGEKFVRNNEMPTYAGDVIVIEIGRGEAPGGPICRVGFASSNTPIEIPVRVREDYNYHKADFLSLMSQTYAALNVTNPANHPVLILEPDSYNTWRRVTYAEEIMGVRKAPWMYVMWHALITTYAHNRDDLGSAIVYRAENGYTSLTPVVGGWPYDIPYGRYFAYNEPELVRKADSIFWTSVRCPYSDRPNLLANIIVCGNNVTSDKMPAGFEKTMEDRIDYQRLEYSHKAIIPVIPERQFIVWRSGKKIVDDGILLSWDLAFQQSHFQAKGADYIRQWVF